MTLLKRILLERRTVVVPVLLLAVVDIALLAFVVYPMSRRVDGLTARAQAASDQQRKAEREYAEARALATGRDRTSTELRTFYQDVVPAGLAGARRITYARLAQMARESNLSYEHRVSETDPSYKGDLQKLHISMSLEGSYRDVREFIHRLETAPDFIVIEHVALAERPNDETGVRLTIDLATYYRPEPHGE